MPNRATAMCLTLAFSLAACAYVPMDNKPVMQVEAVPTVPVRWRVDPDCMNNRNVPPDQTREALAAACRSRSARDLITIALSGGGTKAAVFSGEALFYLDFLGLLERTSAISAVSGGSFAGSIYALSCEPGSVCAQTPAHGRERPVWDYASIMQTLGQGYHEVVKEQAIRAFTPFVQSTVSAERFAEIIDRLFLGQGKPGGKPFIFSDLNPARPHLFLNATIVSAGRAGLDDKVSQPGCSGVVGRHFLRRRTPDEYFHFAFTDLYFSLIKSKTADYPLAAGVAASSAFPALIDFAVLHDHCTDNPTNRTIQLMDGGANDNQALIELYMVLAELVYRQHRSNLWTTNKASLETLDRTDRAFLFVINSSVTETTGTSPSANRPYGIISLLDAVISKSLAAIDVYSAEGYTLRKQSYLTQAELLHRVYPEVAWIYPSEIALTALDQYANGGTEAAVRYKAQPEDEKGSDIAAEWASRRITRQRRAYDAIVDHPDIRARLRLPGYHPQCYFAMRQALDSSLIGLDPEDQSCLKEGARWAAALRAQEMCDSGDKYVARPDGLHCENGHVVPDPRRESRIPVLASPSPCEERIRAYLPLLSKPAATEDERRVQCRAL